MGTVGSIVRELRRKMNLKQEDLADRTMGAVKRGYITAIELDRIREPSSAKLTALAKALQIEPSVLHEAAGYAVAPKNGTRPDEDDESLSTFLKSVPLHDKKRLSLLLKRIDEMIDADIESVEKTGHGI